MRLSFLVLNPQEQPFNLLLFDGIKIEIDAIAKIERSS